MFHVEHFRSRGAERRCNPDPIRSLAWHCATVVLIKVVRKEKDLTMDMRRVIADAMDWAERNGGSLAAQLAESYNVREVDISPDGVAIAHDGGAWYWIPDEELLVRLARIGYGVTVDAVRKAANAAELDDLVERAAIERMRVVYRSESYLESAERIAYEDDAPDLVDILRAAEQRWFELGVPDA